MLSRLLDHKLDGDFQRKRASWNSLLTLSQRVLHTVIYEPRQMLDGGKRIPSPTDRNSIQLVHTLKAPRGSGDRETEMSLHMPHGLVMPGTNFDFMQS